MAISQAQRKEREDVAARPYARELVQNADGTWFARVVEFPGCMTEGETTAEALANLEDAMLGWIGIQLDDGYPIPPPQTVDAFSGKFMLRVAKSLHRDLSRAADIEGVSLNQYVSTQLARVAGERTRR